MDKKTYLLKLLNALENSRPVAKGLKLLIENNNLDEKTLDALLQIFKSAVHAVADEVKKAKLEKSVQMLEKMKQIESQENTNNQEDLNDLEALLNTI